MKLRTFLWVAALSTALLSCKDDDNDRFKISFDNETYDATFYTSGETEPISIVSDIGVPDVTLAEGTDSSISYNADTGVVSWTNLLPLDETMVTVIATVGSRETSTTIAINNSFTGLFEGTYGGGFLLDLQFDADGTLAVTANGMPGEVESWSRDGSEVEATYNFGGPSTTLRGTLTYDAMAATLAGEVYGDDGETVTGTFSVTWTLDE